MAGSQDPEGPSSSPRRKIFSGAQASDVDSQNSARSFFSLHHASPCSMPSFERLQYSNKESVKVNSGLCFGASHNSYIAPAETSVFHTNKPALDIDFGQLIAPIVASESLASAEAFVHKLLHPPPHAFVHGVLSLQWVIAVIGQQHITFRNNDERYVLASDSELRKKGTELGMPALYMEWLCGDDEDASAAEQGLHLTPEYFHEAD